MGDVNYTGKIEGDNNPEKKVNSEMDLNRDGKFDEKDKSIAGKVLAKSKSTKQVK